MTDPLTNHMAEPSVPSYKPLTLSRLFVSTLITTSIICGVIGGLGVLFFADGLFDIGQDPALPTVAIEKQLTQTDQRLQHLEKMSQHATTNRETDTSSTEIADLQKKVQTLSADKQSDSKAAQIALGLTQIKTAYENDLPMTAGIETLKGAVSSESMLKTLNELSAATSQNFPSKKELLVEVNQMKKSLTPAPADPHSLTWDQRAKQELNKFVTVQSKQTTAQKSLLTQAEDAIRNNDFTAALAAIQQIPASTEQKIFYKKIEMRARVDGLIYNVITSVTQKIGVGNQGSLY